MSHNFFVTASRRLAAASLLVLALGLSACGGDDGDNASEPAGQTSTEQPAPAPTLDKVTDTPATAKAASAAKLSANELQDQTDLIAKGLKDGGFDARNLGKIGGAKANFPVDTQWAVYLYDSERSAAEFVLQLREIRADQEGGFELFRIGNRVYYATMTSELSAEDRAKLDDIAKAVEGSINA
jgi:hypothetical protein